MKRLYYLFLFGILLIGCQDRLFYQNDYQDGAPVTKSEDLSGTSSINEPYVFLSEKDSTIWTNVISLEDQFQACEIPEETLKRMTTEALVRTVLKYPLNVIYSAYDNHRTAIELVFKNSALHRELANRNDAAEVLLRYFAQTSVDKSIQKSVFNKSDFNLTYVNEMFFEYFLASRLIPSLYNETNEPLLRDLAIRKIHERRADTKTFSEVSIQPLVLILGEDPDELCDDTVDSLEEPLRTSTWTWYSVFNSPLTVEHNRTELTDDEVNSLLYNYCSLYQNSIVSSNPSNRYNGNGYAWLHREGLNVPYSPTPSMNNSWLESYLGVSHQLSALLADDIYEQCSESDAEVIYYVDTHHSAIRLPSGKYLSKWGIGPLMEHNPTECPFVPSEMQYYRKRTTPVSSGCSISGDTSVTMNSTHYYTFHPSPLRSCNIQWSVENITTGNSSYVLSNSNSYTCSVTFLEASTYIIHFDAYLVDYYLNLYHIVSEEKIINSTAP